MLKVPKDTSLQATSLPLSRNLLLTAEGNIVSLTYVKALFPADLVPHHVTDNTWVWWICFMVMSTAHQKQEHPSSLGNDQVTPLTALTGLNNPPSCPSFPVKDQSILPIHNPSCEQAWSMAQAPSTEEFLTTNSSLIKTSILQMAATLAAIWSMYTHTRMTHRWVTCSDTAKMSSDHYPVISGTTQPFLHSVLQFRSSHIYSDTKLIHQVWNSMELVTECLPVQQVASIF